MKMRFPLFAIAAASVFAASCTADKDLYDENYKNEVQEATYEQQFMKMVGSIGAQQDWNMATSYTITVDPGMSSAIKVFAPSTEGVSQLVADYQGMTGKQTITFTAVENTNHVYVVDAFGNVKVVNPNNGFVSFQSSRVVDDPNSKLSFDTAYWETQLNWTNKFEIKKYVFSLVSKTAKFPIYFTNGGTAGGKNDWEDWGVYYWDNNGNYHEESVYSNLKPGAEPFNGAELDFSAYGLDGLKFGLFVEKGGVKYYDYGTGNDKKGNNITYSVIKGSKPGQEESNYIVVGFDLGKSASGKYDDARFVIGVDNVDILDEDEFAWALACEDMGQTGDFDFNDVVFSASYVAGNEGRGEYDGMIHVLPLAAGGTLSSWVYYDTNENGTLEDDECIGEIHELLGVPAGQMTNTSTGITKVGDIKKVAINKRQGEFQLDATLKNFYVVTEDPYGEGKRVISLPEMPKQAPHVICIPSTWAWPKEQVNIVDAYPEFATWSQNPTSPTTWYMNIGNPDLVIKRK